MRRSALTILLLTFIYGEAALATVVVVRAWPNNLYGITKDKTTAWLLNDYACFRPVVEPDKKKTRQERVACGQIVRVTKKGLIINITGSSETIKVGDRLEVERVDDWAYRDSGFIDINYLDPRDAFDQRNLSLGVNIFQPNLHFEQGITRKLAVGFLVSYLSQDVGAGHITGLDYSVTASWYSKRLFDGIWVTGGAGWYLFRAQTSFDQERQASFSVFATLGYKWLISRSWDFGVAGGGPNIGIAGDVQYFFSHAPTKFDLNWNGVLPIVLLQLGWKF